MRVRERERGKKERKADGEGEGRQADRRGVSRILALRRSVLFRLIRSRETRSRNAELQKASVR